MDWFNQALETVKKGAEELGENAKNLGETVSKQAMDGAVKLRETIAEGDLQKAFEGEAPAAPAEIQGRDLPPWADIPEGWNTRRKEWRVLVQNLHLDPNTFLVGPAGRTEPSSITWERDEVSAERQIASAAFEPLEEVRFKISPKFVSDADFWKNYVWKVRELSRHTESLTDLEATLRELNKDPKGNLAPGEKLKNRGIASDGDKIAEILTLVKAEEENTRRIVEMVRTFESEVKTSEENAALLTRILGRGNSTSSDLKDSVYESCRYHKQKVAQLTAQAEEEDEENRSSLPVAGLAKAHTALSAAVELYEQGPSEATSTSPTPEPASASPQAQDKPAHSPQGTQQPSALSEDYFGGALPWEDDTTTTPAGTTTAATEDTSLPWEEDVSGPSS